MPAVGALGEPGPEEITGAGDGMVLVPPGDPEMLAGAIEELFAEPRQRAALGALALAAVVTGGIVALHRGRRPA